MCLLAIASRHTQPIRGGRIIAHRPCYLRGKFLIRRHRPGRVASGFGPRTVYDYVSDRIPYLILPVRQLSSEPSPGTASPGQPPKRCERAVGQYAGPASIRTFRRSAASEPSGSCCHAKIILHPPACPGGGPDKVGAPSSLPSHLFLRVSLNVRQLRELTARVPHFLFPKNSLVSHQLSEEGGIDVRGHHGQIIQAVEWLKSWSREGVIPGNGSDIRQVENVLSDLEQRATDMRI